VEFTVNKRLSVIGGVLSSALIAAGGCGLAGSAAAAGGLTTSSVVRTAKLAIAQETSVHVVFVAHSDSPSRTEDIVADVGRASGTEAVTEGNATLDIRLTPTHAYVSGNADGLTKIFGMSASDAKKVGKDWESWKSGTTQYANLKSDLTMSSVSALLPKIKGTTLSTVATGGTTSYALKWTIAATASTPQAKNTLTVSSGALTLPVKETAVVSSGATATTALSEWGERIAVSVPPSPVTIASSKISS
jgi:hypothetical protein